MKLRTGEMIDIRIAQVEDAEHMISFVQKVGDETDFLTFSSIDFTTSIEEEKKIIQTHLDTDNKIFLLAIVDMEIVGMLNVNASPKPRLKHIGEFGVSVLQKHWGKSIASILINTMIDWAKQNSSIRKINLKVNVENTRAISLYERLGFEYEGRVTRDLYINGVFFDSHLMGMEFD